MRLTERQLEDIMAFLSHDFTRMLRENPSGLEEVPPNALVIFKVRGVPWADQFNEWTDEILSDYADDYECVFFALAKITPVNHGEHRSHQRKSGYPQPSILDSVMRSPREFELSQAT